MLQKQRKENVTGTQAVRLALLANGYWPVPVAGKAVYLPGWSTCTATAEMIASWEHEYSNSLNTGLLTRTTPAMDIDIKEAAAAEALAALVREHFGNQLLRRVGQAPKQAYLFKCAAPFKKLQVHFIRPDGSDHDDRIEILCDGQQLVVDGLHRDTRQPYVWHGGTPLVVARDQLVELTATAAQAWMAAAKALLVGLGWQVKDEDDGGTRVSGTLLADDPAMVAYGLALLANDDAHYEYYTRVGFATSGALGPAGYEVFDGWARKSKKYIAKNTFKHWNSYQPNNIGAGTIFRLVDQEHPGWRWRYYATADKALMDKMGIANSLENINYWRAEFGLPPREKDPEPKQKKQPKQAPPPAQDNKLIITFAEWKARDLPPPDFICGQWLTTTTRALLYADTGLGKTLLAMTIGMAAATGKDCMHWRGVRPAKVLYIDGEMSRQLLKQRLIDEAARLGVEPDTFFAVSKEDLPAMEPLNTRDGQACIEAIVHKYCDAEFIIFDNIMALIAGDQKDEEGWRETMPWIRSLTQRNVGQMWVHHTGHDTTRSYGTKTREWQMDTVISLEKIERADTDVSFQLKFGKARERTPATRADYTDVNIALVNNAWTWERLSGGRQKKPSPQAQKFFETLCIATAASGAQFNGHPAAAIEDWRKVCIKCGLLDPQKPDSERALFNKNKRVLIEANWVACNDTTAWTLARNPHTGPL